MSDLKERFDGVYKCLEESDLLAEYIDARNKAIENKAVWAKIVEFQKLHKRLCEREAAGDHDFGFLHHVSSTYHRLMMEPVSGRFLHAENELLGLLKYIEKGIDRVLMKKGILGFGSEEK